MKKILALVLCFVLLASISASQKKLPPRSRSVRWTLLLTARDALLL